MNNLEEIRKKSVAVFLACNELVANDLSKTLHSCADELTALRKIADAAEGIDEIYEDLKNPRPSETLLHEVLSAWRELGKK